MGRVAQLDHDTDSQVDPLLTRCHAAELRTLMYCRVPGCLHFDLHHKGEHLQHMNFFHSNINLAPYSYSSNILGEKKVAQQNRRTSPYLRIVVFDNVKVKEVILIFPSEICIDPPGERG